MITLYSNGDKTKLSPDGELCRDAIETFGVDRQIEKATEELAELIVEIQKFKGCPNDERFFAFVSEYVDVEMMLLQLRYIYEVFRISEFAWYLETERKYKRERLAERIAEAIDKQGVEGEMM